MSTNEQSTEPSGRQGRVMGWMARHKGWLIGGGFVAGAALAFAPSSADETLEGLKDVAPWVVPGMAVAEAAWIGGAALVVSSAGGKNLKSALRHPIQTKSEFADIARQAGATTRFRAGFVINTAGAVAEFVIPAVAVTTHLPPESWGILTLSTADLAATIVSRTAIVAAVQENNAAVAQLPSVIQEL
jgi:hypothetical protein